MQSHRSTFPELKIRIAGLVPQDQFLDQPWVPRHRFRELLPLDHTNASLFALAAAQVILTQDALSYCRETTDSGSETGHQGSMSHIPFDCIMHVPGDCCRWMTLMPPWQWLR